MKITREVFAELFGAHVPTWSPSAWVQGVQYTFVIGATEIDELERLLLAGVTVGKA